MQTELDVAIKDCAERLKDFKIDGASMQYKKAETAIKKWVNNFIPFLTNTKLLARVLNKIVFVSDTEVLDRCLGFIRTDYCKENTFFTSLGAETESSARITSTLNSNHNYAPTLQLLLQRIHQYEQQISKPVIVFIDDFLNTGGQLTSIIDTWFNAPNHSSNIEKPAYTSRSAIDNNLIPILKKCELHFVFLHGTTKGCKCINKHLKKYGLTGETYIINTFIEDSTFGTNPTMIEHALDKPMGKDSIFTGFTYKEVKEIYTIFEAAGRALIKLNKPNKSVDNRIFGYGNMAQLFISQRNVPTVTLTCLWMGGEIELFGKTINWQPLIKRKEKDTGSEEYTFAKNIKIAPNNIGNNNLGNLPLDTGGNAPFDITFICSIPKQQLQLKACLWNDCTHQYLSYMTEEIIEYLLRGDSLPPVSFCSLDKKEYYKTNSNLSYRIDDYFYPFKIKNILRCNIDETSSFLAVRIQFKNRPATIIEALKINYHIPINNKQRKGTVGFSINKQDQLLSAGEFLYHIIGRQDQPTNPFTTTRFRSLVFLREHADLYSANDPRLDTVFSLLARFDNCTPANLNIKPLVPAVKLDLEASIGISDKGSVVLCGYRDNQNKTFLAEHYHTNYFAFYLLAWQLQLINRKVTLSPSEQSIQNSWNHYKYLIDMQCSYDDHLNTFFATTLKQFKLTT